MRNIPFLAILLIFFSTGFAWGQTEAIAGKTYTLTGKIIGPVERTAHCGFIAWAIVIELEIEAYSDSNYKEKSIPVIVMCHEFKGDVFLKTGSRYQCEVSTKNPASFDWAIPNEDVLLKYPSAGRLWVTDIESLE